MAALSSHLTYGFCQNAINTFYTEYSSKHQIQRKTVTEHTQNCSDCAEPNIQELATNVRELFDKRRQEEHLKFVNDLIDKAIPFKQGTYAYDPTAKGSYILCPDCRASFYEIFDDKELHEPSCPVRTGPTPSRVIQVIAPGAQVSEELMKMLHATFP